MPKSKSIYATATFSPGFSTPLIPPTKEDRNPPNICNSETPPIPFPSFSAIVPLIRPDMLNSLFPSATSSAYRENWTPRISTYSFHNLQKARRAMSQIIQITPTVNWHLKERQWNMMTSMSSQSGTMPIISKLGKRGRIWKRVKASGRRINVPWRRYNGNEILPKNTNIGCERKRRRIGEKRIEKIRNIPAKAAMVRSVSPSRVSNLERGRYHIL